MANKDITKKDEGSAGGYDEKIKTSEERKEIEENL